MQRDTLARLLDALRHRPEPHAHTLVLEPLLQERGGFFVHLVSRRLRWTIVTSAPRRPYSCASSTPDAPPPTTISDRGTDGLRLHQPSSSVGTSAMPSDRRKRRPRAGRDDELVVAKLATSDIDDPRLEHRRVTTSKLDAAVGQPRSWPSSSYPSTTWSRHQKHPLEVESARDGLRSAWGEADRGEQLGVRAKERFRWHCTPSTCTRRRRELVRRERCRPPYRADAMLRRIAHLPSRLRGRRRDPSALRREGEGNGEVASWIFPPVAEIEPGLGVSASSSGLRNLSEISVRISSPARTRPRVRAHRHERPGLRRTAAASRSLALGVPARDVRESVENEVAAELAVHHGQHITVERGRDAGAVVVCRFEESDVLHEVRRRAEAPRRGRAAYEDCGGSRRAGRPEVADRRSEKRETRRRWPSGSRTRWCSKSPTTAVHLYSRVFDGDRAAVSRRACSDTSKGTNRRRRPASTMASSSSRVFSDEPEPGSTSVFASCQPRNVAGMLGQDRPLAAGEVVLRQPGDLVEERRAALVVEPLRRESFGVDVSPRRTSSRNASSRSWGVR